MWSRAHTKKSKQLIAFRDWIASCRPDQMPEATRRVLAGVPQSPPHHAEGGEVMDHVTRMQGGLNKIVSEEDFFRIEEVAQDTHFQTDMHYLRETIIEHKEILSAFIALHDLGKAEVLRFTCIAGSKGEAEGFMNADADATALYKKLKKAHKIKTGKSDIHFFDVYEIEVNDEGYAKKSAGRTQETKEISDMHRLSSTDQDILTWLIVHHEDIGKIMGKTADKEAWEVLAARAGKRGLDTHHALDLMTAVVFLEMIGALECQDGETKTNWESIKNIWRAEEHGMPERREARQESVDLKKRKHLKEIMRKSGLAADDVFSLLKTPHGPKRGEVMSAIKSLITKGHARQSFGKNEAEIRRRVEVARMHFDHSNAA